jgi:hypothetical protein
VASIFEGNSSSGIEFNGGRLEVDRTQFLTTGNGILAFIGGEVFVDNSLFVGNSLNGLACNRPACRVRSSTFDDNAFGIFTNGGSVEVESAIFSNNRYAIQNQGNNTPAQVAYSDFWQNTTDLDGEITQGEGNLFEDPEYVASGNYRLSPASACIDAAAPNGPDHDLDGTARPLDGDALPDDGGLGSDMGAYEYNPNPDSTGGSGGGGTGGASGEAGEGNEGATGGADVGCGGTLSGGFGGGDSGTGGDIAGGAGGAAVGGSTTGNGGAMGGSGGAAPDPDPSDARLSKGCGCRQPGAPRSGEAWLLGLMLMGVLAAKHRRA